MKFSVEVDNSVDWSLPQHITISCKDLRYIKADFENNTLVIASAEKDFHGDYESDTIPFNAIKYFEIINEK